MRSGINYQHPSQQEENTPLVAILETKFETGKATSVAVDSRGVKYTVDLLKAAFGGITQYPLPGSQWYLKKISGVWTLMARAPQQNPQLDPAIEPFPGDSYIGGDGVTYFVSDVYLLGAINGLDDDLNTIAALTPTNNDTMQYISGAWANRTPTQARTTLGAQAQDGDLDTIAGLSPSNDDFIQRKSSAWANRTVLQVATDLALYFGTPTAPITTSSNGTTTSGTTETIDAVLGPITFTAQPGVRYRVTFSGRSGSMTVADDRFLFGFRYTIDGSTPTNTSTALGGGWRYGLSQAATIGPGITATVTFIPVAGGGSPTTIKVSTSWGRTVGTGTLQPQGSCELGVQAIGFN